MIFISILQMDADYFRRKAFVCKHPVLVEHASIVLYRNNVFLLIGIECKKEILLFVGTIMIKSPWYEKWLKTE